MSLNAIVFCGPSGVGKGTLLKKLFANYTTRFAYSVSHTTRAPREGEQDGREYHFSDRDTVKKMEANNEFLELCDVHGNLYGTSVAAVRAVQSQGKTCVIEIDVQGAQKLANRPGSDITASYFFITAPPEELRKRIIGRGSDSAEMVERRLQTAQREYDFLEKHKDFFAAVIVNDDLEAAYKRLVDAINVEFKKHGVEPLA